MKDSISLRWLIGLLAVLTLGLLAQAALAEQGQGGQGRGRGKGEGGKHRRPPVVFGTLKSVSGDTWTIKPELRPHMQERRDERGKDMPQLLESITVTVSSATKFYLDGAAASAGSFKAGDKVVVKLDNPVKQGGSVAQIVADPETAREFIMEKLRDHREGGRGGGKGLDGPGGDGPGGQRGPRPIFGTITAVSSSGITVKPEVPDFLAELAPKRGEKLQGQLPASVNLKLDGQTKYIVNKQEQGTNPFQVGDKVAVLPISEPGSATARIVSDYASAKAKMQQRKEKREQRKEKREKRNR